MAQLFVENKNIVNIPSPLATDIFSLHAMYKTDFHMTICTQYSIKYNNNVFRYVFKYSLSMHQVTQFHIEKKEAPHRGRGDTPIPHPPPLSRYAPSHNLTLSSHSMLAALGTLWLLTNTGICIESQYELWHFHFRPISYTKKIMALVG